MRIKLNIEHLDEKLINLPFFVFRKKNLNKRSKFRKFIFLFQSYLVILCFKSFNKKLLCVLMNLFYKDDGKVSYSESKNLYSKEYENNLIYFPNKYRLSGSMVNHDYELMNLLDSYCLDSFNLDPDDTIIDCGANVGNLYLAISKFHKKFNYVGFEPDINVYECLKLNTLNSSNVEIHNFGLSDTNSIDNIFYIDSNHGDSSLEYFDSSSEIKIETKKLDSLKMEKIKLFKIDAEGHELEVLIGSKETLKVTEYICIDMGGEKGEFNQNTVSEVTNFLLDNNFRLIDFNENRITGLFENKKYY